MATNSDAAIKHVFDEWHVTNRDKNLEALMALYTEDTIFESPAVYALGGNRDGVLRGKAALTEYFKVFFAKIGKTESEWYRTGEYFTNGSTLSWEYPRVTPTGEQVDLVEQLDIRDGKIAHHRVYWGWIGFRTLLDKLEKSK